MKAYYAIVVFLGMLCMARAGVIEVGLALDSSGSISDPEWQDQIDGYVAALSDQNVLPRNGTVAVGIWYFGSLVIQAFPTTIIDSTTFPQMISALQTTNRTGGQTAVGDAIAAMATELTTNSIDSVKQILDISTDGTTSFGQASSTAADNALAAGIDQINCLAIEFSVIDLCDFVRGDDAFARQAVDFKDIADTLKEKLTKELSDDPECENGGTKTSSGCQCAGSWSGSTCSDCSLTCSNNYTLDMSTCTCGCQPPWGGADCSKDCGNVWTDDGEPFVPEEWFLTSGGTMSLDSSANPSLNAANAAGGQYSKMTIAPDGGNIYLGGGLNDPSKGYLNNLKRYEDGSLFYLQQITGPDVGIAADASFGRVAVSHDNKYVYAVVLDHSCSTPGAPCSTPAVAYLALFTRDTGNKGVLTYVEKYTLDNTLTDLLIQHDFRPDIHVRVTPDDLHVVVAANMDTTSPANMAFRPKLMFFSRDANITDIGETCPEAYIDFATLNFKVDVEAEVEYCPSNFSQCINGVCSNVDEDGGKLTFRQTLSNINFDGYEITDVHLSFDSEFIYFTSEGYMQQTARSALSLDMRSGSVHTVRRNGATSWTLASSIGLVSVAGTARKSLRMVMSPNDRYAYFIYDNADQQVGGRTIEVRTRSLLDGALSRTPIVFDRLGPCDYDPVWHPIAICATKRYMFLHSKRAGHVPEGLGTPPSIYNSLETQQEMFFWDRSCPQRSGDLANYLRYTFENDDQSGMYFSVEDIACDDDYAYFRSDSGEIIHAHVAPRNLEYKLKQAVTEAVYEINVPIDALTPSVKGGTVLEYVVSPALPNGITIDSTTGVISGTSLTLHPRTEHTVTAKHRMGFSTTSIVALTIVEDTTKVCPPIELQPKEESFGFDVDIDSAWWWLLWALLALLLCLLCCIYRMKKQYKRKEAILLQESIQNVHHYHNEDGEEERQEIEMSPLAPVPTRKDKMNNLNKGMAQQLRLRSTGEKDIFIFGTRRVQMNIISDKLMVRVGGGWMECEKFVQKNARAEARKMGLDASNLSFDRVGEDMQMAERQIRRNMAGGEGKKSNRRLVANSSSTTDLRTGEDETYIHHPSMSMDAH